MTYDYSNVPSSDLIPPGTIANAILRIRPGGVGEDGQLTRSSKGDCEMLSIEYTVVEGLYARRKFFEHQIVNGTTPGHQSMAEHYLRVRKQILQSARNIKKGDTSPQARAAYQAKLKDFDGLIFRAKIGIGKGNENYDDKNIIAAVITPGHPEYRPVVQAPPPNGGGAGDSAVPSASSEPSSSPAPQWAR